VEVWALTMVVSLSLALSQSEVGERRSLASHYTLTTVCLFYFINDKRKKETNIDVSRALLL